MAKELSHPAGLQPYISTSEAAHVLGVHPVAVRRMVAEGRLPGMKVARNWIIPKDALLKFARTYVKGPGRRKPKVQERKQS